ncbi:MATE family efflux transporter [Coprococcus comes]|uniref:MATE family efflux transporter n=1 Tax=Coprococcus comes TaxID=410072 RepID=UPI00156F2826|nr:MATE family efflux transporter [Coprococcus comes]NSC80099.1 MATE family efflux transporter [Coprococcus comes]NSE66859.1 MATE family efflux transporter [Coprococcus comes]NSE69602.1 MATE family efflux transporter [Coprococcus comes]NSE75478.1 MATE family efflux transporter [Coprococcus comes]NSE78246.1 MATE family efflux transporter [Coprococcus comes]
MGKTKQKQDRSHYLFSNRELANLIGPLVIEQLLAVFVGMADSIMVANVGEAAVSGVSLVDNIMILIINIFAALATGGAVVAGQYIGRKDEKSACKAATQLVWFVSLSAVAIMILVYFGKDIILNQVFGHITAEVKGHADIYLLIVTASIPFIALYNGGAAIFRAMGNSQVSMRVSLLMNAINVTGNAILVFGLRIGTAGVAIPTLISRMVTAIVITVLLCNQTRILHIERTLKIRFDGRMIRKILAIGVPNGLENSMFQLGKILVLSLVSTFGTYAIAANAVSNAIALFQILPGMAISLAITTVISQCVGANDYEQVHYYLKKLLAIIYVAMVGTVALIFLALPLILKAYNLSDQTAAAATNIIHFHGISAMIIWPLSFALPAAYRAAGDAKACMYTSIVSMWIFRIGFSYLVGKYMGLGVFGVWVAMVIDWVVRAICFIIRYFNGKWKHGAIV